ncbi:MAG: gfo/Idh/MocA family oxidoreductase, partial [Caldilineaceae bacterium]
MESFYDGYVVNAIMDACYRSAESRQWEPVVIDDWRSAGEDRIAKHVSEYDGQVIIKQERMPDGKLKMILKHKETGAFSERVVEG